MVFSIMSEDSDSGSDPGNIPIYINDETKQHKSQTGTRTRHPRGPQAHLSFHARESKIRDRSSAHSKGNTPGGASHQCRSGLYANDGGVQSSSHTRRSGLGKYVNESEVEHLSGQLNSGLDLGIYVNKGSVEKLNSGLYANTDSTYDNSVLPHHRHLRANESSRPPGPANRPKLPEPRLMTDNKASSLPGGLFSNVRISSSIDDHRTNILPSPPVYTNAPGTRSSAMAHSEPVSDPETESYTWFFADLNREGAESKLMQRQTDGMYVVRNSSHGNHAFCLSVFYINKVFNIRIRQENNQYLLGEKRPHEPSFSCLEDLISHYQKFPIILKSDRKQQTVLKQPLPK